MDVWYQSETRFISKIVNRWDKNNVRYNKGNVNILKYAYRTATFWAMVNSSKISKTNQLKGYPKLF